MINKLKCCLYILMAKRYIVYTVDDEKGFGKRTHLEVHRATATVLSVMFSYLRDHVQALKDTSEQVLKDMGK